MTGKIKLAFVVPSLKSGGAERVVATLANHFSVKYDVTIISLNKGHTFYWIDPGVTLRNCGNAAPSSNSIIAVFNNIVTIKKLRAIYREDKIAMVLSFTTSANVLSIFASRLEGIPVVVSERNNPILAPPNFFWRALRNISYKFSNYLIVQTSGNKNFYERIVRKSKIKIIQNPISKDFDQINEPKNNEDSEMKILSVGRLTLNKATHIALNALARIKELNWQLTIVGDGPTKSKLLALSRSLHIGDRVHFAGITKNVSDYYNNSDIFVFTSRSEGFPNALMEAYYFGIPCISTDCAFGPSDIITDGHDGFLIPVDDENALKEKLKTLMNQPFMRAKFSENALNNSSRFEAATIADQWTALIDKTLEK